MKENKVHYKVGDWLFIPYEDKFILDGKDFLIEKRLSNLFVFLCQHPHQIFSRDELINEVWHGMILTDQVITQAIFELRKILKQNGEHPFGYIVTVSKRGYKLDSDVELIELENHPKPIAMPRTTEQVLPSDIEEKPAKTEVSSKAKRILIPKISKKYSQFGSIFAFILLVSISIGARYLNDRHEQLITQAKEQLPAPSYLSYEPRYIQLIYASNIQGHRLGTGLSMYLLRQLKTYKDFRIISNNETAKKAANVIVLDIINHDGDDYLTVKFNNKISGAQHLSRNYNLDSDSLQRTLNVALDDMLDAFSIDVDKQEIANRVNELPHNPDALQYTLSAFSASPDIIRNNDALMDLSRSLQIEPNNQYTYSANYMLKLINTYLLNEHSMDQEVAKLNQDHETMLTQFYEQDVTSFRTLEALAMLSLSKDLPLDARKYLKEIPYNQRTVFYYLTFAKLSEATGDTIGAEEYYHHAMTEVDSSELLSIGEVMFFDSSLKQIKEKVESLTL
ncbi:winged helix-turn-helix domain-containing protein [Vibrio comitans]|nr:winged helix-turn-helix domain-containing protein [Vibrio comitans]